MTQLKLRQIVLGLCLAMPISLPAETKVGDTSTQVLQENGAPLSKLGNGKTQILRYRDRTIKLEDGIVVSVQASLHTTESTTPPATPAAKTPVAPRAAPGAATSLTWQTNFADAVAQAKAEDRKVFVFFTGSDWCGWCMRLNKEILSTPEFARYSKEKLILVEIDFPRGRPQPAALKNQNTKLAQRFHVEGFPTVIVLDSAGKKVGTLGYQEGGPGPFVAHLSKL